MNLLLFSAEEWEKPLTLQDRRAKHILSILKLKKGDYLLLGLENVGLSKGEITKIDGNHIHFTFPQKDKLIQKVQPFPLSVLLGHPRPPTLKRLVKDLSSMGVAKILVLQTVLSEKSYFNSKLWKNNELIDHAWLGAEQGGLVTIPEVIPVQRVKNWWDQNETEDLSPGMIFHPYDVTTNERGEVDKSHSSAKKSQIEPTVRYQENASLISFYRNKQQFPASVLIGPERGWTDKEVLFWKQRGFKVFGLGKPIMRTESAAVSVVSQLRIYWDENESKQ